MFSTKQSTARQPLNRLLLVIADDKYFLNATFAVVDALQPADCRILQLNLLAVEIALSLANPTRDDPFNGRAFIDDAIEHVVEPLNATVLTFDSTKFQGRTPRIPSIHLSS